MYARMYVCMQVCMYVCMYVCTYVRMYVCISAFWYVSWCNAVDLVWIGQTTQNLLRCFISSHCLRNSWFVGVPFHTCSWPCWLSLSHLLLQPRSLPAADEKAGVKLIQAPCVSSTKVFWFPFLDTLGHMLLCHNIKALRRCSSAMWQKQRRAHETSAFLVIFFEADTALTCRKL